MTTELRLILRSEGEHELAGWWVAAGSSCPAHEVGVLIVVSPAEAARMIAQSRTPAQIAAAVLCATRSFARAIQQVAPGATAIISQMPPPPRPPTDPSVM